MAISFENGPATGHGAGRSLISRLIAWVRPKQTVKKPSRLILAVLKTIFNLVLGPSFPWVVPGEGLD